MLFQESEKNPDFFFIIIFFSKIKNFRFGRERSVARLQAFLAPESGQTKNYRDFDFSKKNDDKKKSENFSDSSKSIF